MADADGEDKRTAGERLPLHAASAVDGRFSLRWDAPPDARDLLDELL